MKFPGNWTIRPLGAADAPALAALHVDGFDEPWSVETFAELLALPGAFGHLAVAQSAPAGFALARVAADEAEILTLSVARGQRRRGLGAKLVGLACDRAASEGAARMFLEVAADNFAALALYRALGFAEAGRRPAYYGKPGHQRQDALLMSAALGAWPRAS